VSAADTIPELSQNQDAAFVLHTLSRGGVSPVFALGADSLGVLVVTEVYPGRQAEFDEVSSQVLNMYLQRRANEIAQEKQRELEALIQSEKGDLARIGRALGLEVRESAAFSRDGNVDDLGPAVSFAQVFDAEVGELVGPLSAMGNTVLCRVKEKVTADMTKLEEQREEILDRLRQQKAQQRRELFEDGVLTQLVNEGKVKINDRAIQRLASSYLGKAG
jgi:hypothetical protein